MTLRTIYDDYDYIDYLIMRKIITMLHDDDDVDDDDCNGGGDGDDDI